VPSQHRIHDSSAADNDHDRPQPGVKPVTPDVRTPEDLARWADAIAAGQVPFPCELDQKRARVLASEVGRRRRSRLTQFIARAIAQDIFRAARSKEAT
jgi:hypothetical protein